MENSKGILFLYIALGKDSVSVSTFIFKLYSDLLKQNPIIYLFYYVHQNGTRTFLYVVCKY